VVSSVVVVVLTAAAVSIWPSAVAAGGGALVASCGWGITLFILQTTGTSATLMGAAAESWTAEELRKLRSQGWSIFDAVPLKEGKLDLDHLAISPAGVFAIETKWSGTGWTGSSSRSYIQRCVAQAQERAQLFANRRSFYALKNEVVRPVLVLWGKGALEAAQAHKARSDSGVTILAGTQLVEWARKQPDNALDETRVKDSSAKVADYIALTEPHVQSLHQRGRYVESGLGGVVSDVYWGVVGAIAGFLGVGFAAAQLAQDSMSVFSAVAGALALLSWFIWYRLWRRSWMLGWWIGALASLPIVLSWWFATVRT